MKNKNLKLSMIVPVYNATQTLECCVNSILKSSVDKSQYEIFLINDGSQDNSLEICENVKSIYNNIEVFSHNNSGTSTTRNVGLENATGEYVWFVDADDYIESSFLEQLFRFVEIHPECDVISFDYIQSGIRKQDVIKAEVVSGIDFLRDNSKLYLWNHIYKKTIIDEHCFLDGTKNIEDWLFNIMVLVSAKTIMHMPNVGYHYCDNNISSTSRNRSRQNLEKLSIDSFAVHKELMKFSESLKNEEQKNVVLDALNYSVIGHLYSLFKYYDVRDFNKAIDMYKNMGLYPTKKTKNKRANYFRLLANNQILASRLIRFRHIIK